MEHLLSSATTATTEPSFLSQLIIIVSVFLATVIYIIYNKTKASSRLSADIPGPSDHHFLGFAKHFIDHAEDWPMETYRLCEKYKCTWGGPLPRIGFFPARDVVNTVDERNIQHILRDNFENYVKGQENLEELIGDGIFSSDGEAWSRHRKIMSHMFSRNLLRHSASKILATLTEITSQLHNEIKSNSRVTLDIQDLFYRMTFDVTCLIALNVDFKTIQQGQQCELSLAFDKIQKCLLIRAADPLCKIKKYFYLSQNELEIQKQKNILDRNAYNIINSRRRLAEEGCDLGPDILSRYLEYSKKHDVPMDNKHLRDVIMNILLAGRDTTACALSWTFYELTRHPKVAHRIVEEVTSICGSPGPDADYSYNNISKLNYTHAVAMEALRLHPSLPNDNKVSIKDDTWPDGTFVPAGTAVVYMPLAMGRNSGVWGEDSLDFKPERFFGEKEPSPFKFIAFNAGPRICAGKPLALLTMKLTMAYLLPRFDFKDNVGHNGDYDWAIIRSMKGGFEVDVTKKQEK